MFTEINLSNFKIFLLSTCILSAPYFAFAVDSCKPEESKKLLDLRAVAQIARGDLAKKLLIARGFVCNGFECKGRLNSYSDEVLVMIPNKWDPSEGLHIHFHGHNLGSDEQREHFHFNKKNGQGDYLKFANEAGFKSLMVFPLSKGKCDTFKKELNEFKKLDKLAGEISQLTGASSDRWSLSFHSGADVIADGLLKDPAIDQKLVGIGLFDSLYGQRVYLKAGLNRLEKTNPEAVNLSFFVPSTSPERHNEWLKSNVSNMRFHAAKGSTHMGIMAYGMPEFFARLEGLN